MLAHCPVLVHLDFGDNEIGDSGAGSFTRQCTALTHLDLGFNRIGQAGAQSLARVVRQCPALLQAHLQLDCNSYAASLIMENHRKIILMKRRQAEIRKEKEHKEGRKKEEVPT